jgi:hypothetical protein
MEVLQIRPVVRVGRIYRTGYFHEEVWGELTVRNWVLVVRMEVPQIHPVALTGHPGENLGGLLRIL